MHHSEAIKVLSCKSIVVSRCERLSLELVFQRTPKPEAPLKRTSWSPSSEQGTDPGCLKGCPPPFSVRGSGDRQKQQASSDGIKASLKGAWQKTSSAAADSCRWFCPCRLETEKDWFTSNKVDFFLPQNTSTGFVTWTGEALVWSETVFLCFYLPMWDPELRNHAGCVTGYLSEWCKAIRCHHVLAYRVV